MRKPDLLRAALTTAFPELARDPDRLSLWVDEGGQVRHHMGANLNFAIEYRLSVEVRAWTHPSIMLFAVLIDWLRIQQPDLVTPGNSKTGISFEADLISAEEADIGFDLMLNEGVRVTKRPDGGFNMTYVVEPDPLMPDTAPILPSAPLLESIWVDGVQLVPEDLP